MLAKSRQAAPIAAGCIGWAQLTDSAFRVGKEYLNLSLSHALNKVTDGTVKPLVRHCKTCKIAAPFLRPECPDAMTLARRHKSLIAWALYFSVLLSSVLCAIGHGQMAGLQLSGLDGAFCSVSNDHGVHTNLDDAGIPMSMSGDSGCAVTSLFSAIILAAMFGLLGLLAGETVRPLPLLDISRSPRHRWPLINPRASPASLSSH